MVLSLELYRSRSRYVAAQATQRISGSLTAPLAPLRLADRPAPAPPAPAEWARLRPRLSGICGSDLATLSGKSSRYLSGAVSFPFVPGHEIVADTLDDLDGFPAGSRVVIDPVLSCRPRGLDPCNACFLGQTSRCDHITVGHLAPGLQTGYCADTGGGWSRELIAHRDQLRIVPDTISDEAAVLVEPLACAVHAVRRAAVLPSQSVLVVGAGTVGLLVLAALRELTQAGDVTVVAKHRRQRELAWKLGASEVVAPDRATTAVRRATRAHLLRPDHSPDALLGGLDQALDCAGSTGALDLALRSVRAGGRVTLAAMPAGRTDLAPAWFRELEVVGAYATSRNGKLAPGEADDFDTAIGMLAGDLGPLVGGLVSAVYPLDCWREALDHALEAGRLGAFKIAFDPGAEQRRTGPEAVLEQTADAPASHVPLTATGRENQ